MKKLSFIYDSFSILINTIGGERDDKKFFTRLFTQHQPRINPYEVENEFMLKTDFPKCY